MEETQKLNYEEIYEPIIKEFIKRSECSINSFDFSDSETFKKIIIPKIHKNFLILRFCNSETGVFIINNQIKFREVKFYPFLKYEIVSSMLDEFIFVYNNDESFLKNFDNFINFLDNPPYYSPYNFEFKNKNYDFYYHSNAIDGDILKSVNSLFNKMLEEFPNADLSFSYKFMREIHRIKELESILHPSIPIPQFICSEEEELKNNNKIEIEIKKLKQKVKFEECLNATHIKNYQVSIDEFNKRNAKLSDIISEKNNEIDRLKNIINEKDKELDNIKNTLYIFQLIN